MILKSLWNQSMALESFLQYLCQHMVTESYSPVLVNKMSSTPNNFLQHSVLPPALEVLSQL